LLVVHTAARELPQEETRRTVFALLAKPLARHELVIGKWLGCWSLVCAATLSFYALLALVVLAKGGSFEPMAAVQAILLHSCALGILAALALALSTRMNQDAAAAVSYALSAAAFLLVPQVPTLTAHAEKWQSVTLLALYQLAPHFELLDMRRRLVHDRGPIGWDTFATVAAYGALYAALLLLFAWLGYRTKRFSRGNA
jgi:ABC-type Na+ efflux pump permease subunit